MKTGNKIALFYTAITIGIISVVTVVFYFVATDYISRLYYSYLTEKAYATAQKHWEKDELDEEDREELRRRAAMRAAMAKRNGIMRVLSIALPLVLDAILIGALLIVNVSVHYEHNVTELRSPDGDRIIYVDNSFFVMNGSIQGRAPFVSTYEKLNPFLVAKLQRPSDQPAPTVLDVSEDNLVWKEDRLRVLYGNTYVDYFYYGVTPPEE